MLKIGIQGNDRYFSAWDFKKLSQSPVKHTTCIDGIDPGNFRDRYTNSKDLELGQPNSTKVTWEK